MFLNHYFFLPFSEGEAVSWTRRQAELFIAQQVNLLQNNENLALPPPKLQDKIRDILQANPDYAEAVRNQPYTILKSLPGLNIVLRVPFPFFSITLAI